jgi:hypothetical protein
VIGMSFSAINLPRSAVVTGRSEEVAPSVHLPTQVTARAALAAARGSRYLQVDATVDSRPILNGTGFGGPG